LKGLLGSLLFLAILTGTARADLAEVRAKGVLRHFAVESANFFRDDGTGLEADLLCRFAESLGVRYERIFLDGDQAGALLREGKIPKGFGPGDVLSGGLVSSDALKGLVASGRIFPSQLWLLASEKSALRPVSRGRADWDIREAKADLKGRTVYVLSGDGAASKLLRQEGMRGRSLPGALELADRLRRDPEAMGILDAPEALLLLARREGVKRLGPLTTEGGTVVLFRAEDVKLGESFGAFLRGLEGNWELARMARAYYPTVFNYFTPFFRRGNDADPPFWLAPDPAYFPRHP
jgi:ABC-type amino acid transport substrate-binding protein